MLQLKDVALSHREKEVLKSTSLSVHGGEIFGIIGPAGCGKSSLLKILSGKVRNFKGETLVDNRPIRSYSRRERAKKICSIPMLPENMDISVFEFILLTRTPFKKALNPFSDFDVQITEESMAGFELSPYRNTLLGELSRSHLKAALLAFCFARNADVLVLDDATDGLDLRGLVLLQKMLFRYVVDGNRTAVLAGNDINFIAQTADKIAIMHEGTIKALGGPEIIEPEIIKQYFGAEAFVSKNVYNGKPNVHFFPEG